MTQMSIKKGIRKHGKLAKDAVVNEFRNMFKEKGALKPMRKQADN